MEEALMGRESGCVKEPVDGKDFVYFGTFYL
jgi:hypothetical protein